MSARRQARDRCTSTRRSVAGLSVGPAQHSDRPTLRDGASPISRSRSHRRGAGQANSNIGSSMTRPCSIAPTVRLRHVCRTSDQAKDLDALAAEARCASGRRTNDLQQIYRPVARGSRGPASTDRPGPMRGCFVPAAGIPWFAALFGRDSLDHSAPDGAGLSRLRTRRARGPGALSGRRAPTTRATCSRARSRTN